MQLSIDYLGHIIDKVGHNPMTEVKAIQEAPAPKDVKQLRSFLGVLTYYGKFVPNFSATLSSIYQLLQKNRKWSWGKDQETAFQKANVGLNSGPVRS